jgi:hypothetical protein
MGKKVTITISLDADEDRDLLRWLGRQENRSAAIREALRARVSGGVTLGDVYQAVKEVERLIRSGVVVAGAPAADNGEIWEEPPDIAAALDALGKL